MKTKKITYLVFFCFIFMSSYAQTSGTFNQFSNILQNIERYEIDNFQYFSTHYSGGNWNHAYVGKYAPPDYDRNVFRMIYSWDLSSIPQNAEITSAILHWAGTPNTDYVNPSVINIQIKEFNHSLWNASDPNKWAEITTSTVLRTESIPVNLPFNVALTLDQNFISYLENSLQQNSAVEIAMRTTLADEESWGTNLNTHVVDFKVEPNIPAVEAVKLEIHYNIPASEVSFFAKNIFETGFIGISMNNDPIDPNELSPYTFSNVQVGNQANLEAIEQPQNGYEWIWNDTEAPNNKSKWMKWNGTSWDYFVEDKATSFTISEDDDGKIYRAGLRKNLSISRSDDCAEFDNVINNPGVTHIVEQNSGQISAPATKTVNGKTYNFVGWTDDFNESNPRTITPNDNETYTALYKYPFHSNEVNTFTHSGGRKIKKDENGILWMVYESMNKVWLERSSDNGATWSVQVLNDGNPAKSPAIATINYYSFAALIVYQIPFANGKSALKLDLYDSYGNFAVSLTAADIVGISDYENAFNPSIAVVPWSQPGGTFFTIVFETNDKLSYINGVCSTTNQTLSWETYGGYTAPLSGSEDKDIYPAIEVLNSSQQPFKFHIAYQHKSPLPNDHSSEIRYKLMEVNYSGGSFNVTSGATEYPSLGSGFDINGNPSLIVLNDNTPRIVWTGSYEDLLLPKENGFGGGTPSKTPQTLLRAKATDGSWYAKFWKYGNDAVSQSINRTDDNNFTLAWTEEDGDDFYVKSDNYSAVYPISGVTGNEIQVLNGTNLNDVYAMGFDHNALPYTFNYKYLEIYSKPNSILTSSAREGTINKGAGEFYFVAGDMFLDGAPLEFEDISVEENIDDLDELNYYLQTKPFALSDNSDLVFSVLFGITDSLKAYDALGENESVRFTMQMTDAETGGVIGTYDDVTYDKNNLNWYDNIAYQVETAGIGERTVRLRLQVETNVEGSKYILGELFAEEHVLGKTNRTVVPFQGAYAVTEYRLAQNYPNPFNPATTIKFEIPETGFVTLKIYDILGREVTTLVNAKQEAGRYEAKFNASGLSSGIYIYRIQAGKFAASKKMILLK